MFMADECETENESQKRIILSFQNKLIHYADTNSELTDIKKAFDRIK